MACSHCGCKQVLVFFGTGGKKTGYEDPHCHPLPMKEASVVPYSSHPVCNYSFCADYRDLIVAHHAKSSFIKPGRGPLGHNSFQPSARAPTFEQHTYGTPSSSSSSDNHRFKIITNMKASRHYYKYYVCFEYIYIWFSIEQIEFSFKLIALRYYYSYNYFILYFYRSCVSLYFWLPRRSLKPKNSRRNVATNLDTLDPLLL